MTQVRIGTFETNSSSVHTLVLCSDAEYKALKQEKAMIDTWQDKVVPFSEYEKDRYASRYEMLDEFFDTDLETYNETKEIDGVIVHAIGKYGHDWS